MYIKRSFSLPLIYFFTWRILLYSLLVSLAVLLMYDVLGWKWVAIPWLPVSLIGTAVSFYVGFKNSQSYDRLWEARKIWGGITNISRAFAMAVRAFVTNEFAGAPVSEEQLKQEKKTLIYRHIAWLYALKHLMWQRTAWEHQRSTIAWYRNYFEKEFAFGTWEDELKPYLSDDELQWLKGKKKRGCSTPRLPEPAPGSTPESRAAGRLSSDGTTEIYYGPAGRTGPVGTHQKLAISPPFCHDQPDFHWNFYLPAPFRLSERICQNGRQFHLVADSQQHDR